MLLADENVHALLVKSLREKDIDILWINETEYRGMDDLGVIKLAIKETRVILTRDKDFLLASLRSRATTVGVIYVAFPINTKNYEDIARRVLIVMDSAKGHVIAMAEDSVLQY